MLGYALVPMLSEQINGDRAAHRVDVGRRSGGDGGGRWSNLVLAFKTYRIVHRERRRIEPQLGP